MSVDTNPCVERVARGLWDVQQDPDDVYLLPWEHVSEAYQDDYRHFAHAAVTAMRPPPGTPDPAAQVQRVRELADELDADAERAYQRSCGHRDDFSDGQYHAYEYAAERIRAALDNHKEQA